MTLVNRRSGPVKGKTDDEGNVVSIPSTWLGRFNVSVELQEFGPPSPSQTVTTRPNLITKILYTADIPIIVLNPLTSPIPSLPSSSSSTNNTPLAFPIPKSNPNTLVVLTSSSPSPTLLNHVYAQHPHTLLIDPTRALDALHTLDAEHASAIAVRRFQDDFVASRLESLTKEVETILSSSHDTAKNAVSVLTALRVRKARYLIDASLRACEAMLRKARLEVDRVADGASALRGQIEEARVKVPREVFDSGEEGEVKRAVKTARRDVGDVLDTLKWWRLVWRVDDIGEVVKGAVDKAWCRDLERKVCLKHP